MLFFSSLFACLLFAVVVTVKQSRTAASNNYLNETKVLTANRSGY